MSILQSCFETGWKKRRNSEARGGVNGLLRTGFQQPRHRGPYPRVSQFSLPKRSSDDLVRVKIRPNALGKDTFTATRLIANFEASCRKRARTTRRVRYRVISLVKIS